MKPILDEFRLAELAEKPWLAEPWEIEILRADPKLRKEFESYGKEAPEMSSKKKENPPKHQKQASAPHSNKTTNNSRPKPNQVCSGCGFYFFIHQLHTCPSCGKQFCDDCYPKHNCKKQRVVPPPNPHIAVDQQEWYNKQPTPCDNCGKIVRADALRKVNDKKLCPDCLLEYANSTRNRDNAIILIVIGAVALIILWVIFNLPR